ncbi:GDP-L-fucose synthase family protein [Gillisia limnaea]|uniref:GDP-L-fucose synthase n=1 Tax=Gillisia limnaea (strain DSM 15749 / LMG 21470 / R-8282) TaxID=865937 RepID=H2BV85_GILLR|nr:GDP-L-fucose synthase [Gillisia limnaea]EHQ01750.1 NAD-dependent epimerase/dehydratase [Gillisia limnaea DSM 15749]
MEKDSKIYIAGHTGMVGSAIARNLKAKGYSNFVFKTSKELDLINQQAVASFFENEQPEYVFLAAAKVGGIEANNTYRAQFLYENLMIQNNVIHQSYVHGVKKLLFLASSCIYPKLSPQPIKEEYLLDGKLEPTNEPYSIAKIAGVKMCENYNRQYGCDFISVMPTNLYGPNDNYDLETAHVLPALLRKFHEAKLREEKMDKSNPKPPVPLSPLSPLSLPKCGSEPVESRSEPVESRSEPVESRSEPVEPRSEPVEPRSEPVELWGTGTPMREFLHVDDLAEACFHLMQTYHGNTSVNIGTGKDISIKELADVIRKNVGYKGEIIWNRAKPDGTPRKLLDVSLIHSLGWEHSIGLEEGIREVYNNKFLS